MQADLLALPVYLLYYLCHCASLIIEYNWIIKLISAVCVMALCDSAQARPEEKGGMSIVLLFRF